MTLRLVCRVTTPDIGRAFLTSDSTMAARITRAKKKIAGRRIPFRMPHSSELPDRIGPVLAAIYLMFTTGHTAPSGPDLVRFDLSDVAIQLSRALHQLLPDLVEAAGLLALMLVIDARRDSRVSEQGQLVRLEQQDRARWDRDGLAEGHHLIVAALRRGRAGPSPLQAAIASLYAEPPTIADTDWTQILYLHDQLLQVWPSPIVALNRIVPLSYVEGPGVALARLGELERDARLTNYPYLPAVKANLLTRMSRTTDAAQHYRRARELTDNQAEQHFLTEKLTSAN